MEAAIPCKIKTSKHGKTCRSSGIRKTKYAFIVEADESTTKRLEGSDHEDQIAGKGINSLNHYNLVKHHQDHITAKGMNSLNHYNLVHKFIPVLRAMIVPEAKAAVEKNEKKTRENTGVAADESQK